MLLSGAFLLALVLLGVVVAATAAAAREPPGETSDNGRPAGRASAKATASGCAAAGRQSGDAVEQPAAGAVGDGRLDAGAAEPGRVRAAAHHGIWNTCFAHNPSGALLAAMNFYGESTAGEPEHRHAPLRGGRAVRPGERRRARQQAARFSWPATAMTPTRRHGAGVAVFRDRRASRPLLSRRWCGSGGDWKYVFPPGGMPSYQVVADLTGYVPWTVRCERPVAG